MIKALWNEFKASFLKSKFHIVRLLGILIAPFLYAFTFTFAFYDPFGKTDQIPLKVITQKNHDMNNAEAHLIDEIANEMTIGDTSIKTGMLDLKLNMEHIYVDGTPEQIRKEVEDIQKNSYTTFYISNSSVSLKSFRKLTRSIAPTSGQTPKVLETLGFLKEFIKNTHIEATANYQKNYLLGFSSDISNGMSGKDILIANKLTSLFIRLSQGVIDDEQHSTKNFEWFSKALNPTDKNKALFKAKLIKTALTKLQESKLFDLSLINIDSQTLNGDTPKYGEGLGPFFIALGMWIGAIVVTFAVNSKINDKNLSPTKRYLTKFGVIAAIITLQATILLTTLIGLGYYKLGVDHWFALYGSVVFGSIVFASITQFIRFTIPNKVFGVFITIIFLVLQIGASGGLFPNHIQNGFFQFINKIVPMTYMIKTSREAMYETNLHNIFMNFGYLSIFLVAVPFGIAIRGLEDRKLIAKEKFWESNKKIPNKKKGGKNV